MLATAFLFMATLYMEWVYLKRHNRKKRTMGYVLGFAVLLFLLSELLLLIKDQWQIIKPITTLMGPVEDWILMRK